MTATWLEAPLHPVDETAAAAARARQARLTKPPGSLGELEAVAVRLAALQGRERPAAERVRMVVFAADHGVAASGVSAFPQSVTVQMVRNFAAGGAAISVLARALGAELEVVDVGTLEPPGELPGLVSARVGPGTANFHHQDAMTPAQLGAALEAGRAAVERAAAADCQLFIGGEMGIANTSAAAAVACALLAEDPAALAGPGTGLDAAGVGRKVAVLREALARHGDLAAAPLETLRCFGGFELAALAGAFLACAQRGIPVLVDGFIAGAAALVVQRLRPEAMPWLLFGHVSAEPGHRRVLEALGGRPLLDLGMRLGEGTGAAAAVPLLRLACALHDGMATFAEAGVAGG